MPQWSRVAPLHFRDWENYLLDYVYSWADFYLRYNITHIGLHVTHSTKTSLLTKLQMFLTCKTFTSLVYSFPLLCFSKTGSKQISFKEEGKKNPSRSSSIKPSTLCLLWYILLHVTLKSSDKSIIIVLNQNLFGGEKRIQFILLEENSRQPFFNLSFCTIPEFFLDFFFLWKIFFEIYFDKMQKF